MCDFFFNCFRQNINYSAKGRIELFFGSSIELLFYVRKEGINYIAHRLIIKYQTKRNMRW